MQLIPGTVLPRSEDTVCHIDQMISGLFLAGDLQLAQVSAITGIPGYMIQNWVKRGYLPPPQEKKYTQNQLCRILCINSLRGCLTMEQITKVLEAINGRLDDESDDCIPDSALYFLFVQYACACENNFDPTHRNSVLDAVVEAFASAPCIEKLKAVLDIMLDGWIAAVYQNRSVSRIDNL